MMHLKHGLHASSRSGAGPRGHPIALYRRSVLVEYILPQAIASFRSSKLSRHLWGGDKHPVCLGRIQGKVATLRVAPQACNCLIYVIC